MPIEKLRQDTVRNLPYVGRGRKHQCIYWDEEKETFGVRVYPSGRRTYVCSYRINRRKRLAKLGRIDVLTLEQARKKATVYLGKVADREDPQKESDTSKKNPRIEELTESYIIPSPFDPRVASVVARAVTDTARRDGLARRPY